MAGSLADRHQTSDLLSHLPRSSTQGPGLLLASAYPAGILKTAEEFMSLLLCMICGGKTVS